MPKENIYYKKQKIEMKDKTLEKIKKLLRLHKDSGSSANEAVQALKKAKSIAEEAGINLADISTNDETDNYITHLCVDCKTFGDIEKLSASLVREFFYIEPIFLRQYPKNQMAFIGGSTSCILASYAFDYITNSMRREWKQADKRFKRPAFLKGFANAIFRAMPNAFHSSELTVTCDDYIKKHIASGGVIKSSPVSKDSGNSHASRNAGYKAGKKVGIRNGLDGTKKLT